MTKQKGLHLELQVGHLYHCLQCRTVQVVMREHLEISWRNKAVKSGKTKKTSSFHSESPHKFPAQLLLLAAHYSWCPQTPWCQLQSVLAPRSTSKLSRSSAEAQAQVPYLLQGHFASILEAIICVILMMAVQQTEDIFGIIHMNLCAWLNKVDLGANGVNGNDIRWKEVYQGVTVSQNHVQKLKFICTATFKSWPQQQQKCYILFIHVQQNHIIIIIINFLNNLRQII